MKLFTAILLMFCLTMCMSSSDITDKQYPVPNSKTFRETCTYYNILFPDIVTAQAILETGNFKSKHFVRTNNALGLMLHGKLIRFTNWQLSVKYYKETIEKRFKGHTEEEYYMFLKNIGYADDRLYVYKIKKIVRDEKRRNNK